MNEMLRDVVVNGTAKKLNFCKPFLYGKTGTVGNKNGNTDAYSISYTNEYILGTWFGNNENGYLDNNITGGNEPTKISASIWNSIYENKNSNTKIELCDNIKEEYIDKISYENENKLILADNNAPEKYKIKTIFKKDNLPKEQSTRFSLPIVEKPILSVNHKGITMSLCLPQYYEIEIIKVKNQAENHEKGLVIKVTDKNLLAQTGGIVQGMSGSPILQNGKLVGAVTHVFINDPTRGYGIFIDNMLS